MKWTNMMVWMAVLVLVGWCVFLVTGAVVEVTELQTCRVSNEDFQLLLDVLLGH